MEPPTPQPTVGLGIHSTAVPTRCAVSLTFVMLGPRGIACFSFLGPRLGALYSCQRIVFRVWCRPVGVQMWRNVDVASHTDPLVGKSQ